MISLLVCCSRVLDGAAPLAEVSNNSARAPPKHGAASFKLMSQFVTLRHAGGL